MALNPSISAWTASSTITMADDRLPDLVRERTQAVWRDYLDTLVPFRPDLYRYCRRLTRSPWDAEDLVQDTLLRAFGLLASAHQPVDNVRGYLVRTATNLWIDRLRRREVERIETTTTREPMTDARAEIALEARDAGAVLLALPRQERAAVLLKDVLDMTLDEIAEVLETTVGAVKSALHRGRGRLREVAREPATDRPRASDELVDRFVDLLNAGDFPALLALMTDAATIEMPGALVEVGRSQFERKGSWLWQAVHVHPDLPADKRPPKWWNERRQFDNEAIMVGFAPTADGGRVLQSAARFEEQDGRVSAIRSYVFSPEVIREVGERLGVPVGMLFYRLPSELSNR
jgi:RNA polymerase sigma-70 factor (ECF subfamily)